MTQSVLVLGASGTIGQATVRALLQRGHRVVCVVRERSGPGTHRSLAEMQQRLPGAELRVAKVTDPESLRREGFCGDGFDALVSCLASRTGAPRDAWAIDFQAHMNALQLAREAGVRHVVLLSAICVQKPLLEFQRAKLAFEQALIGSGLTYSIVRPTAFFKSLSGQFDRVREGRPYLLFGNGTLTRCKPISDRDLADYLADCLTFADRRNRILPIGGPGPAISPLDQAQKLFELLGRAPKIRSVPPVVLDLIIATLSVFGRLVPALGDKAELARIGRYYASESMLVLNNETGEYDEAATPSTGRDTLFDYYAALARGEAAPERGDHAVF